MQQNNKIPNTYKTKDTFIKYFTKSNNRFIKSRSILSFFSKALFFNVTVRAELATLASLHASNLTAAESYLNEVAHSFLS